MPVLFEDDPEGTPSRKIFRKVYQYGALVADLYYTGGKGTALYMAQKQREEQLKAAKKLAAQEMQMAAGLTGDPGIISAEGLLNITEGMGGALPMILVAGLVLFVIIKR